VFLTVWGWKAAETSSSRNERCGGGGNGGVRGLWNKKF